MSLPISEILDTVQSHALATGLFAQVNGHEPKSAPGTGLTAAVWVDRVRAIRGSGLASTSGLLVLNVRLYTPMTQQPLDAIDPTLIAAQDTLMAAYAADFELDGRARQIDLQGAEGTPLSAEAGYLSEGGNEFRVVTISLPIIVNDLWPQSP